MRTSAMLVTQPRSKPHTLYAQVKIITISTTFKLCSHNNTDPMFIFVSFPYSNSSHVHACARVCMRMHGCARVSTRMYIYIYI